MENADLKWIKKHYGEKFSHLCRDLFPTILEKEGFLIEIIRKNFSQSRELYDDIVNGNLVNSFKSYIYSQIKSNESKMMVNLTPEELMDKAGYILYPECKTENDIQSFRHFYHRGSPTPKYSGEGNPAKYEGEELCTFNGGRLKTNRVWFAVKKNVDEIRRKDFKNPRREDDYGVSVLSIQFSRSEPSVLSIKNRYNHTVPNPDATFSNNLDNIVPGLTQAFENTYGISLANKNSHSFEIPGYVQSRDGKFYKYNQEIDNFYYCPNNTIIENGVVRHLDENKYILFDAYILDLERKEIISCVNSIFSRYETGSFIESVGKIKDIKRVPTNDGLTLQITPEEGEIVEIKLNKLNEIVSYYNPNVEEIGNSFLEQNESLTSINLPNAKKIGEYFLLCNKALTNINLPNVEEIGNSFLEQNESLTNINLPKVKKIGCLFLRRNKALREKVMSDIKNSGREI